MNTKSPVTGRDETRPEVVKYFNWDDNDPALGRVIQTATIPHKAAESATPRPLPIGGLLGAFTRHHIGQKDGPAAILADLPAGPRKKENVRQVTALGLDLDDGIDGAELDAKLETLGAMAVRYTTHSHTAAKPKHRVVFPFEVAFDLTAEGEGDPARGCAAWARVPHAMGKRLEVEIDSACVDPARAFFLPRHPQAAPHEASAFGGPLLDWRTLELAPLPAKVQSQKSATAAGSELRAWVKSGGGGFQIADALDNYADERIRARASDRLTAECPFDHLHSNAGSTDDHGFFVRNAGDGPGEGFVAHCAHNHCSGFDRLDFVAAMIEAEWLPASVLTDSDFFPLGEAPTTAGAVVSVVDVDARLDTMTPESDAAEVEAVAAMIGRLGVTDRARRIKALAKKAGIDAPTAKQLVKAGTDGGRAGPISPELISVLAQVPQPSAAHGDFGFQMFDGRPWVYETPANGHGGACRLFTPWGIAGSAQYPDRDNRYGLRLLLLSGASRLTELDVQASLMADERAFCAELKSRGVLMTRDGAARAFDLAAQIQPARPTQVYDRPGWRAPGLFLTPWGQAITADPDACSRAALASNVMPKGAAQAGSLDGWISGVNAAFNLGLVQFQVGALAAFVSPIMDLCGYESRTVFFTGAAGRGKSTSHEIQASAWGDPGIKMGLFGTFDTTPNALEVNLQQASGAGFAADELKVMRGKGLLQQILFMTASGSGKSRMDYRGGGLRGTALWCCLLTASYEDSLASFIRADGDTIMPGLGARVLEVASDGTLLKAEAVAPVAAVKANFGHSGPAFVRALFDQGHVDDPDALAREVEAKADRLMTAAPSDQRRAAVIAALLWQAGEIATEAGLIPPDFKLSAPAEVIAPGNEWTAPVEEPAPGDFVSDLDRLILKVWRRARTADTAATDPLSKAVETLTRNLVTGIGFTVAEGNDGPTRGERRAFRLDSIKGVCGEVFVIPVDQIAAVTEGPFTAPQVAKALEKAGLLIPYKREGRGAERIWPHVPGLGKIRAVLVDAGTITGNAEAKDSRPPVVEENDGPAAPLPPGVVPLRGRRF